MTQTQTQAPALPDYRADVYAAQQWVAALIAGTRPDQLTNATPCTDFDVEALIKHLYGVAGRVEVMGSGQPAAAAPATVEVLPDDIVAGYRDRVEAGREAWRDDVSLTRMLEVPWGTAPAAAVLAVYVAENVEHGWDLAVATGQDSEADPRLAEIGLQVMHRVLPAAGRDDFPFADPVEPAADAGPTERLANWTGRSRPAR